jgi:hypothetical protein
MIINVRGTSGSGKSTLVRRILENYKTKTTYRVEKRKQPIGYVYHRPEGKSLAVIGHYETPCGGCDTINDTFEIFRLVRESHKAGYDVLFEGLLISADVNRVGALHLEGLPLLVIALQLPIEDCLQAVNERRRMRKPNAENVNPKNTTTKHRGVILSIERLRSLGVNCESLNREDAYNRVKKEFYL